MATSMRALLGKDFTDPHREAVTAVDALTPDSTAFKNAVTALVVLGCSRIYVQAKHDNSGGTMTARICYYNEDDELVAVSSEFSLDANTLADASGAFIGELKGTDGAEPGAHAARVIVTALATSTDVDIFMTYNDAFTR